jgi:LacI family transcriptional regulator
METGMFNLFTGYSLFFSKTLRLEILMNMIKRDVTIYDVAKVADTSPSTVSRVLSDSSYRVSPRLKERVEKAAEQLGYLPNLIGRQLKKNSNTNIGVVIPSISNPFYPNLLLGVEERARRSGNHIFLCNSYRSPEVEREYLYTLYEKQVKGILISSISSDYRVFQDLQNRGVVFVSFDQEMEGISCSNILFDYEKAGFLAMEYLFQKGHRRIGYISAPLNRYSRIQIMQGVKRAVKVFGLEMGSEYIQIASQECELVEESYEFQNGKSATQRLLSLPERPSAILACNDMTAFGVYHQVNEYRLQIPQDISVIGMDDIPMSSMISPGLTSIHLPNYEMGKLASQLLIDLLNNETTQVDMMLPPKVVERNSVRSISIT